MKEKHLAREQEKKKRKDQSPNKRPHPKVQNAQWGALREKNMKLRMKQVVQENGRKIFNKEIHLKFNIFHILGSKFTKSIPLNQTCPGRSDNTKNTPKFPPDFSFNLI